CSQGHSMALASIYIRRTLGSSMLFYRTTRKSDGKRVESKIPIGLVRDFPEKGHAWAEVETAPPHQPDEFAAGVTFGDLPQHYAEHELVDHTESIHAKTHTTVRAYERVIRNRCYHNGETGLRSVSNRWRWNNG